MPDVMPCIMTIDYSVFILFLLSYYFISLHRIWLLRRNKVSTLKSTREKFDCRKALHPVSKYSHRVEYPWALFAEHLASTANFFHPRNFCSIFARRRCRDAQLNWDSRIYIGLLPSPALWQRTRGGFDGIDFPSPGPRAIRNSNGSARSWDTLTRALPEPRRVKSRYKVSPISVYRRSARCKNLYEQRVAPDTRRRCNPAKKIRRCTATPSG